MLWSFKRAKARALNSTIFGTLKINPPSNFNVFPLTSEMESQLA